MLSRGVSVIRGTTLIVNLPGSPKAVKESLGFIMGSLDHGLKILRERLRVCQKITRRCVMISEYAPAAYAGCA